MNVLAGRLISGDRHQPYKAQGREGGPAIQWGQPTWRRPCVLRASTPSLKADVPVMGSSKKQSQEGKSDVRYACVLPHEKYTEEPTGSSPFEAGRAGEDTFCPRQRRSLSGVVEGCSPGVSVQLVESSRDVAQVFRSVQRRIQRTNSQNKDKDTSIFIPPTDASQLPGFKTKLNPTTVALW